MIQVGKKLYRTTNRITRVRTLEETNCKRFLIGDDVVDMKYFDAMSFKALKKLLAKQEVIGLKEM